MVDDKLIDFLTMLPNMAVAVYVIWRGEKLVTELLATQRWMVEQLMALHPPQDKDDAAQLPPPE